MNRYLVMLLALLGIMLIMSSCNINNPSFVPTPTVLSEVTFTPSTEPTATQTLTPQQPTQTSTPVPLPSDLPQVATATPTNSPAPPTLPPPPTDIPGPFEYVIQDSDTLMYIIQLPQHGYGYELDVAQEVVDLNENMTSIDFLPPAGSTILIPRPTSTATAIGAEATADTLADIGVDTTSGAPLAQGSTVGCYEVQEDDSLVSVASEYNTTLEIISQLNPELSWFGCDFTLPSGGLSCNPTIQIGQCINVPQPTPMPTSTSTPSGNETATPTPTYPAPRMVYPSNNSIVPAGQFDLQWVAVSGLQDSDEYLVEITDTTTGQKTLQVTSATAFTMPETFVPTDGQPHLIEWRVSVTRKNEQGVYGYVGGQGGWLRFQWMSQ
mgnify:CR=1 FL=1